MTSHLRLLPVSPIKLNVLQNNSGIVNNANNVNNSNIVNNPNQNLLKINSQTITAKADSTHDSGDSSAGDSLTPVAIDPRTGVPFKKHHHSVKKFQTPSVSRRNARERNRVKQVNFRSCNSYFNIFILKIKDQVGNSQNFLKQICNFGHLNLEII